MLQNDEQEPKSRGDFLVYLLNINRQMQNKIGEQTRRVGADTYDRNRKPKKGARHNGTGRTDLRGTFQNRTNKNYRRVNKCAE